MNDDKIKIDKLLARKGKCEVCSAKGYRFYRNKIYKKTLLLCKNCFHILNEMQYKKTTKYLRLYGFTLTELAAKYGGSISRFAKMHRLGRLKKFLDNQ